MDQDELYQLAYRFIEENFGQPIKHVEFSGRLIKLMSDAISKARQHDAHISFVARKDDER